MQERSPKKFDSGDTVTFQRATVTPLREKTPPRGKETQGAVMVMFDPRAAEREERRAREKELGQRISVGRDAYLAEQRERVVAEGNTAEEIEVQLAENIKADKGSHLRGADALAARDELVGSHLSLVDLITRRFRNRAFDDDDLKQQGSIALIGAAERFEPERGLLFSTLASSTIKGDLQRMVTRQSSLAHFDRPMQELRPEVYNLENDLMQRNGGAVSEQDLVEELLKRRGEKSDEKPLTKRQRETEREKLLPKIAIARRGELLDSFDTPVGEHMSLGDQLKSEEDVDQTVAEKALIAQALQIIRTSKDLSPKQKRVLELRFTTDKTQEEIGVEIGYSQMHVSRLITKGVSVIKEELGDITDY